MVVVSLKKRLFSVRYRYNNGQYAKNAFIKDNDGNVYYFDNTGRMAIGERLSMVNNTSSSANGDAIA